MALTNKKLSLLRRGVCKDIHPDFDRVDIDTALNAGKDWITANKASAVSAIETVIPGVFNNALKKKIYAYLFELQFSEDK